MGVGALCGAEPPVAPVALPPRIMFCLSAEAAPDPVLVQQPDPGDGRLVLLGGLKPCAQVRHGMPEAHPSTNEDSEPAVPPPPPRVRAS